MTVAAVILAASPESALAPADGVPRVRRLADVAWAGGAMPIVVVAADPDGQVAVALAGAPVTLAAPAPRDAGPVGQILRGIELAVGAVRETDAALVWPARMAWVDPETVTSLIEAHGADPAPLLRPAYAGEPGWPALVPTERLADLRALSPDRMPDDLLLDLESAGVPVRRLDVGDPGTTHDGSVPREELPAFEGPTRRPAGGVYEWGSPAADRRDDAPLEGPAVAPYGQAVAPGPDRPA